MLERDELPFALTAGRVRRICEAHFGVFADGLLLLCPPELQGTAARPADLQSRRVAGRALGQRRAGGDPLPAPARLDEEDHFSIQTDAGIITPQITGPDTCRVDMGAASLVSKDYPGGPPDGAGEIEAGGHRWRFQHVSIGNPQCSIGVEDLASLQALDLGAIGPQIEADLRFPNRTNVSW